MPAPARARPLSLKAELLALFAFWSVVCACKGMVHRTHPVRHPPGFTTQVEVPVYVEKEVIKEVEKPVFVDKVQVSPYCRLRTEH